MNGKHRVTLASLMAGLMLVACSEEGARELVTDPQMAPGTSLGVNLDQCANAPRTDPCTWQNGNLNGNNSVYAEGLVVPFRLAIQGLPAGNHSIRLNYDFTAGGHKAYDYLASVDATEIVNICAPGGGGRSALCDTGAGSNTTMPGTVNTQVVAFTGDAFPDPESGKTVDQAIAAGFVATQLTVYNATNASISVGTVTHDGATTGNSTGDIVVSFTTTGGDVALAWGGHLAKSSFWNSPTDPDGAGEVSGAPWHMRTLNLTVNGVVQGAKNQDRSIQPSAIIADPMLEISKEVVTDSSSAGDTLRFKINVWNSGEGDAINVMLEDTLPSGFTWTVDHADCVIASDILACGFGDLMANDTAMVTISTPTDAADCGTVPNVAHADADNDFPVSAGDTATVICPNLMIEKVALTDTVTSGDSIKFKINVWNPGPGTASNVMLTDTLPNGGLSWVEDSSDCSIASGILTCDFGDLPAVDSPGDTAMVTIAAETDAADCGTVTNRAWADGDNGDPVNDVDSLVVQCPDLSIQKVALVDTVAVGDTAVFTITVSNDGPGDAYDVMLKDTLPNSGLTWSIHSETPDLSACSLGTIAGPLQELTCDIGTLLADSSFTVVVKTDTIPSDYLLPAGGGTPVAAIEIDGNLFDNGGVTGIDWHDAGIVCETIGCKIDEPTGTSDNSFAGGTKEDTEAPGTVTGSIPNNKSDLLRFYITSRKQTVGDAIHDFLYVAWERVQAPNGTTNMDIEFNQDTSKSANGVTPVRSAGDILVKYDLAQGGITPTLGYHTWITAASAGGESAASLCEANNKFPCWGKVLMLSPPAVAGAINTGSVVDSIAPNAPRTLDPLTFGEAGIDLQASGIFQAGVCRNFGSAYLKSRSSDSFTSQVKDFIAPVPINVSNCQPRDIPNTAWAQASNYAPPPSGSAGDWISDGDTITVTENGVASLFAAPTVRLAQASASDGTFGSVATPAEASADLRVLPSRPNGQTGAPWPVNVGRKGLVSSRVTDARRRPRMT